MKKISLAEKSSNFWNGRDKNGAYGLALLVATLNHVKDNRDWDALAVFTGRAIASNEGDNVKRIIKAAFGDRLTFDAAKAKTHPSGVAFKMTWDSRDMVQFGNAFAFVEQAVANGKSFNNAELHKTLKSVFAKPKVDKDQGQLVEALAKAAIAKAKETGIDLHMLFTIAQEKADQLVKEKAQKDALKGK